MSEVTMIARDAVNSIETPDEAMNREYRQRRDHYQEEIKALEAEIDVLVLEHGKQVASDSYAHSIRGDIYVLFRASLRGSQYQDLCMHRATLEERDCREMIEHSVGYEMRKETNT